MSIPSSSDAVATRILISPRLRRRSASSRKARDSDPWCAATFSFPNRSPRANETLSTSLRVLTKTSVDRWLSVNAASLSKISSHMGYEATDVNSSVGTSMARSIFRFRPTWITVALWRVGAVPVRKSATNSMGFWVAERPMRCGGVTKPVMNAPGESLFSPQTSASRRSRDKARWAPLLSWATACISSTMMVSTRFKCSRLRLEVSRI